MKFFAEELDSNFIYYLDSIFIFIGSIEEHREYMRYKLHKCDSINSKIDYIRFEISSEGVYASPER